MAAWLRFVFVVLLALPSAAAAGELLIVNSSGKPIYELYLVPTGERSWGPDYLGRKQPSMIARGETYALADLPPGSYQLMMVVDGSECQIDSVVIASEFRVDLTPQRLRQCIGSN